MERLSSRGEMMSRVELERLDHSSFDLGKHNFLSGKLGKVIPARVSEVYPGDTLKGRTEIVANFEPLAGPIQGTMVTKQESFYVANSYVWKNAHKFYTGKNGFDRPMPCVAPSRIFSVYSYNFRIPSLETIYGLLKRTNPLLGVFPENFKVSYIDPIIVSMRTFGEAHQVLDILQPIIDKYEYYFVTKVYHENQGQSDSYDTRYNYLLSQYSESVIPESVMKGMFDLIADFFEFIFNFFFGPSSMLDYMGHPILDDWHEFFKGMKDQIFFGDSGNTPIPELPDEYFDVFSHIPLNWLPFRAAYLVWYWNYRDQLLETSALDPEDDDFLADTVDDTQIILLTLLRVRCWYKDSYTTALTNTGYGNFGVPVESGDFDADGRTITYYDNMGNALSNTTDARAALDNGATVAKITSGGIEYEIPMNYLHGALDSFDGGSTLSTSSSAFLSLDLFDRVSRLRRFTRKELILGYEYDDVLWSSFRVRLSNYRMRIPELLDRGRDVVSINTIVNNTTTTEQIAGDKTAVAWSNGNTDGVNYFVEEHGFFLHFFTIMPIPTYVGGLQRLYLKKERFDVMWPEFATMGMDAIYNAELAAPTGSGYHNGLSDDGALSVYGYQGRYYDLKGEHDEAHGRFRTDLNYMLFTRQFDKNHPPKLNYISVHCWPRLDMFVVNDPSVDVIRTVDVYTNIDGFRTLPVESERV